MEIQGNPRTSAVCWGSVSVLLALRSLRFVELVVQRREFRTGARETSKPIKLDGLGRDRPLVQHGVAWMVGWSGRSGCTDACVVHEQRAARSWPTS